MTRFTSFLHANRILRLALLALLGLAAVDRAQAGIVVGNPGDQVTPFQIDDVSETETLEVMLGLTTDTDGDGVPDPLDNCISVPNAGPLGCDTDMDGYGNACDADFNNDGVSDGLDFMAPHFLADFSAGMESSNEAGGAQGTDMNCDGTVDGVDFVAPHFLTGFAVGAPGPSGLSCAGTVPCPPLVAARDYLPTGDLRLSSADASCANASAEDDAVDYEFFRMACQYHFLAQPIELVAEDDMMPCIEDSTNCSDEQLDTLAQLLEASTPDGVDPDGPYSRFCGDYSDLLAGKQSCEDLAQEILALESVIQSRRAKEDLGASEGGGASGGRCTADPPIRDSASWFDHFDQTLDMTFTLEALEEKYAGTCS